MENKGFRIASGVFGFLASVLFVVYVFQTAHTLISAVLYTSFALLAYSLVSYLLLSRTTSRTLKAVPLVYLGSGLALIYLVVALSGGSNTFLYLALTTALLAAISYFYAFYSSSYGRNSRKFGTKAH